MKLKTTQVANANHFFKQFGIMFYGILFTIILLITLIQIPASVVVSLMERKTDCKVVAYLVEGSIWKGSTALGFSIKDPYSGNCKSPMFITERLHWTTQCQWLSGTCEVNVSSSALKMPVVLTVSYQDLQISSGELALPANLIEIWGGSIESLKPRANILVNWSHLNISGITSGLVDGDIQISILNLSSSISPIKDLGSYDIRLQLSDRGSPWTLTTVNGPLTIQGIGHLDRKGLHFSGQATVAKGFEDSLQGILNIMGQKNDNGYRIEF